MIDSIVYRQPTRCSVGQLNSDSIFLWLDVAPTAAEFSPTILPFPFRALFLSPGSDLYLLICCKLVPMIPSGVQCFARTAQRTQRNNLLSRWSCFVLKGCKLGKGLMVEMSRAQDIGRCFHILGEWSTLQASTCLAKPFLWSLWRLHDIAWPNKLPPRLLSQ